MTISRIGATKTKEKYERIARQTERRRLYVEIAAKSAELTCKGDGDFIFHFQPLRFEEKVGLIGKILEKEQNLVSGVTVIANFALGEDKYFLQTMLLIKGEYAVLNLTDNLYLMQRRAHFRVDLDEKAERALIVIQHSGKAVFVDGDCLDISAGGARIQLYNDLIQLKSGDILKVAFHLKGKWKFEATGTVRHLKIHENGEQVFGFEFDVTHRGVMSKIQLMMLELQRATVMPGR